MANNTQVSKWVEGSKVQGVYYDARFTGTVKSIRQHSKNRAISEVIVTFDVPVKVNNEMRVDCAFYAYEDGRHWADSDSYIENYTGGSVTTFKVGNRVEVLVDRVDDPISDWKLGKIIGSQTIGGVDYWHVHVDGTKTLDHVKIDKRNQATHLKHSDAPMPDQGNPLTQRQKDSGRFEKVLCHTDEGTPFMSLKRVDENAAKQGDDKQIDATTPAAQNEGTSAPVDTNTIDTFQVGDRFNECDYAGNVLSIVEITKVAGQDDPYYTVTGNIDGTPFDWRYTYDELQGAIEVGHLVELDKRVIIGEVVTLTNDLKVNDLVVSTRPGSDGALLKIAAIRGNPGNRRYSMMRLVRGEWRVSFDRYEGELRPATVDERLKYLQGEADRLDEEMAKLYDERASVVQEIERLRNEKFYSNQVQKSVNFRAQYPTLQDYLNSLTGR